MGGIVSAGIDNDDLVDKLKEAEYIESENIEKIFRLVDRGYYLTKDSQNLAYRDNAWRSGNLHISAPCIYAKVMEGLQIGSGMSFLNIGSGTGYLSTMAGLLIGPRGVNHGIELHSDVVEYARERLQWFITNTGSIDVSFFCEPQFTQGNALCLKEDTSYLYDRVYCGASCPTSHEGYMKNLIKIDGILVMPKNDKLLKIVRTGQNSWTTSSLLPVSFSSLVMPDSSFSSESIELPAINIVSLQELSREVIRSTFREHITAENSDLKGAFVYEFSANPTPRNRKPMCRVNRAFPNPDRDTDRSDDQDSDWDVYSTPHELEERMHSAFIEVARSLVISRSAAERERGESFEREVNGEGGEENEDEIHEMNVDNGADILFELLERATRDVRSHHASDDDRNVLGSARTPTPPKEEEEVEQEQRRSEEREGSEDGNEVLTGEKDECEMNDKVKNTAESSNSLPGNSNEEFTCSVKNVDDDRSSSNDLNSKPNNSVEAENMETVGAADLNKPSDEEKNNHFKACEEALEKSGESDGAYESNDAGLTLSDTRTDEEMDEVEGTSQSRKEPASKENGVKKKLKKREKFDSGIVEDLDHAMSIDSSSSGSSKSRSSSSDSSLSDDNRSRRTLHPDSECPKNSKSRRTQNRKGKIKMNVRKRKTITYEKESKTDSKVPIDKYSRLMKDKISKLPLPPPLKIYLNYNRPL